MRIGDPAVIGILDVAKPDFGDAVGARLSRLRSHSTSRHPSGQTSLLHHARTRCNVCRRCHERSAPRRNMSQPQLPPARIAMSDAASLVRFTLDLVSTRPRVSKPRGSRGCKVEEVRVLHMQGTRSSRAALCTADPVQPCIGCAGAPGKRRSLALEYGSVAQPAWKTARSSRR